MYIIRSTDEKTVFQHLRETHHYCRYVGHWCQYQSDVALMSWDWSHRHWKNSHWGSQLENCPLLWSPQLYFCHQWHCHNLWTFSGLNCKSAIHSATFFKLNTFNNWSYQCYFIIYLCGILYNIICRILQVRFLFKDNVTHQRYERKYNNFRMIHFIYTMVNLKFLIVFSQNFNSLPVTKSKEMKKMEHQTYFKYYSRHLTFKVLAEV